MRVLHKEDSSDDDDDDDGARGGPSPPPPPPWAAFLPQRSTSATGSSKQQQQQQQQRRLHVVYLTADASTDLDAALPGSDLSRQGTGHAPPQTKVVEGKSAEGAESASAVGLAGTSSHTNYVLVLGGVCDHKPKPGIALSRAHQLLLPKDSRPDPTAAEQGGAAVVTTARLPLSQFVRLGKGAHLPLLACAQLLLLARETGGDWGAAIEACPAFRCAPLRKYVTWLPPRAQLNSRGALAKNEEHRPKSLTETRQVLRLRTAAATSTAVTAATAPMQSPTSPAEVASS
mmetsp:Transcript_12343/g.25068  ORF Transcript_12343/g.25068 Transcript_12343/m.25068 type:complete len:287 (-) Transcript_12343:242-1102(-)